jgi:hypothetical protein
MKGRPNIKYLSYQKLITKVKDRIVLTAHRNEIPMPWNFTEYAEYNNEYDLKIEVTISKHPR